MRVKTATTIFATLILSLFILLGISLIKITSLLEAEASDLAIAAESISVAKQLKLHLLLHNRNAFFYSFQEDQDRLVTSENLRMEIMDIVALVKQLIKSKEAESALNELQADISSYLEKLDRFEGSGLPAIAQYNELSKEVDKILPVVDKLIAANQARMDALMENIDKQNRMADKIAFVLPAIGGGVLISLMGIMFLLIAYPLRIIADTISKFAAGNAAARVKLSGLMEIRQIGSNFNSMAERLEEKQREQLRFIAAIAHDLRNPLGSMSMASELLDRKGGQECRDLVGIISRQVKNLDRMVGDLLDTTRIEAGHIELKLRRHNINFLIMDSIQLNRTGSDLHRFNIDLPDDPLFCRCDGGRISQVLNNLLSNAIKYSPNGGEVTVKAHRAAEGIVVSVSDQGIGIAAQDLDDIFKPFNRTQATRSTIPGIGLGLSASRRIVEAHGGKLWVESTLGSGSTFYFSLPAKAD